MMFVYASNHSNQLSWALKREFSQKWQFCHYLLTLVLFETRMIFFPLWNSKGDSE